MAKLHAGAALCLLLLPLYLTACGETAPQTPASAPPREAAPKKVLVTFTGGHETDPRDKGRPVLLIANTLGVTPEVFREAFSRVQPAPAGTRPTPERERRNKAVLLAALKPYGVTNERLDEVSDYYRYRPGSGELWPTQEAVAYAMVKDGEVLSFHIEQGGSGYSSAPIVTVTGAKQPFVAQLGFGKDFDSNGAVTAIVEKPAE
jgi:hypothetical protein